MPRPQGEQRLETSLCRGQGLRCPWAGGLDACGAATVPLPTRGCSASGALVLECALLGLQQVGACSWWGGPGRGRQVPPLSPRPPDMLLSTGGAEGQVWGSPVLRVGHPSPGSPPPCPGHTGGHGVPALGRAGRRCRPQGGRGAGCLLGSGIRLRARRRGLATVWAASARGPRAAGRWPA